MKKATKKQFCKESPDAKKLRAKDFVQFEILFNEWKRRNFKTI
jgi:hypothetical protein